MKRILLAVGAISLFAGLGLPSTWAVETISASGAAEQCKSLERHDFSRGQEAPTQVVEAKVIEASGGLPAYCHIQGYIAPNVGIEMRLPTTKWNGKFLEVGCGGYCGDTSLFIRRFCDGPLRKGYACIGSDMGHKGSGALWAYNNLQAEIDYGYRAAHVAAVAGKAITKWFYGRSPSKSYFFGCSTGGRQGLVEAQQFPWDFDGIIAGAPAINLSATLLNILWASLAVRDESGIAIFSEDEFRLVHDAVLARCDHDDGLKDGVIGNPRACKFDPWELICTGDTRTGCLSAAQAEALEKIYRGPTTSKGQQLFTDGAMPGSELFFTQYLRDSPFARDFFRYLAFVPDAGPNWQPRDFNFDHDYKRLSMMEALYAGTNPDLRRFKLAGGKIILYHGWADAGAGGIAPLKTVDYYKAVERTMGGRAATQDFLRLFMVPGMGHCTGGAGAFAIDYLGYLEAWVEHGKAPDVIVGAHVKGLTMTDAASLRFPLDPAIPVAYTRPVYPYPVQTRYKGVGDPNRAESFIPVNEE